MNTTTEQITLKAEPAAMGWAILAESGGQTYMVEGGLRAPEGRLKYWQDNLHVIKAAIAGANK